MLNLRRSVLALSAAALLAGPLPAQTQLAQFALQGPFGVVGQEVGVAGDWDGDGVTDALAAGPTVLAVYSGATGAELAAVPLPDKLPLHMAGLPDIDGDGHPDVVLGDGDTARAVSTADGAVLWSLQGSLGGSIGWSLAVLGDLDGDLFPDVAVGEPDADPHGLTSAGTIWVLSGDSGALIERIDGTAFQQQLGIGMAGGPDFDDDGLQDLFVADTDFLVGEAVFGRLLILAATSGEQLQAIPNDANNFNFGRVLAGAGDLDGDGLSDPVASSSEASTGLEAFSSKTALELWDDIGFPTSIAATGDATGDGVPDLVTGFPSFFFNGSARLLDGATGNLVNTGTAGGGSSFAEVAGPGDLDGDGLGELFASTGGLPPGVAVPTAGAHFDLPGFALLHSYSHPAGGDQLGQVVDAAGDLDGDGTDDWLVSSSARLLVFSGADGAPLLDADPGLLGTTSIFALSAGCTLGDADADGVTDFVLANGNFNPLVFVGDGRVKVLSGADGSTLAQRDGTAGAGDSFGISVAATTDHDGDGVRDLYVGASAKDVAGFQNAGEVVLVSGTTLATLATLHGLPQVGGAFGTSLNTGGDLTGDGVPELAVGSADEGPAQFNSGALYLLDGASHAVLHRFDGALNAGFVTGAITGDLDGDDVPDVLAAEPQYLVPGETVTRGRLRAFSGATYALLWQELGPWPDAFFGGSAAGAGDVNGDGFADVVATSRPAVSGSAAGALTLLSGPDGALLDQFEIAPGLGLSLGRVRSAGHFDEGGCADVIVGVPSHDDEGAGYVFASSQGGVHGFVDVGLNKAGSNGVTPTLRGYGDLSAGGPVTLKARHALPFKACTWFIGLDPGFVPFKKGTLVPDPFGVFFPIPLVTDATGQVVISANNPSSVFAGLSLWHQFWFSDPAASAKVSASNGMQEIFK